VGQVFGVQPMPGGKLSRSVCPTAESCLVSGWFGNDKNVCQTQSELEDVFVRVSKLGDWVWRVQGWAVAGSLCRTKALATESSTSGALACCRLAPLFASSVPISLIQERIYESRIWRSEPLRPIVEASVCKIIGLLSPPIR